MMETMIPPTSRDETPDEKIKKNKKRKAKKRRPKKRKKEKKRKRANVTILLPQLCFRVAPCSSYRESLELSL